MARGTRCVLVLAALAAASGTVESDTSKDLAQLEASLEQDDECFANPDSAEGDCALNALQRRGLLRAKQTSTLPNRWCSAPNPPKLWSPDASGPSLTVRVLSYNLFWWSLYKNRGGNDNSAAKLIKASMDTPFDFMGFQECEDPVRVLEPVGLLNDYEAFLGTHAICVAYRKTAWTLLAKGEADVAEDMPTRYYGRRGTQWMRLKHTQTGKGAFFVNHHGPLSINSGGICGGEATAHNLLKLMAEKAQQGDLIILVGDFNANAASLTIQGLWSNLVHIFNGDSFGGVDNVFSNAAKSSIVSTNILGNGGSDHTAISASVRIGGGSLTAKGLNLRSGPESAVATLLGKGAPGDDWSVFWCGRMESDVQYIVENDGGFSKRLPITDPDRCCKECQKTPECKAFIFMDQSGGNERCVLKGGQVTSRTDQTGFVSGLPAVAAAAAAAAAARQAISAV